MGISDFELEQRLKSLVRADIIEQGRTNFDYRGVSDNIFDKVFRTVYQKDIQEFDHDEIREDYQNMFDASEGRYQKLLGQYNQEKGLYAEILFLVQLRHNVTQNPEKFLAMTSNLPQDFVFVDYLQVNAYQINSLNYSYQVDFFAQAEDSEQEYSIVGEVKNRIKRFSLKEAKEFHKKIQDLAERESLKKVLGFVFSYHGFTKGALGFFRSQGIAWSKDSHWFDL